MGETNQFMIADLVLTLIGFLWPLLLILIGWFFGRMNERAHYKRLEKAEAELSHILMTNMYEDESALTKSGEMVTGSCVVANDAFKRFLAFFRKIFGGKLGMYERLMERARREALIRMLRDAESKGAPRIIGVRLQSMGLSGPNGTTAATEVLAYGTAIIEG